MLYMQTFFFKNYNPTQLARGRARMVYRQKQRNICQKLAHTRSVWSLHKLHHLHFYASFRNDERVQVFKTVTWDRKCWENLELNQQQIQQNVKLILVLHGRVTKLTEQYINATWNQDSDPAPEQEAAINQRFGHGLRHSAILPTWPVSWHRALRFRRTPVRRSRHQFSSMSGTCRFSGDWQPLGVALRWQMVQQCTHFIQNTAQEGSDKCCGAQTVGDACGYYVWICSQSFRRNRIALLPRGIQTTGKEMRDCFTVRATRLSCTTHIFRPEHNVST